MAAGNSLITDPSELQYISDVVNQVLSKPQELGSIKDFQAAVRKKSSELGREVQVNLVPDQNRVTGLNFSFADDPAKKTPTISFSLQEKELAKSSQQLFTGEKAGAIALSNYPNTKGLEVSQLPGNLATKLGKGALVPPPPLQVEGTYEISENPESLKSPPPGLKMNLGLARAAEKLAARNELDGLWLSGTALKTITTLAQSLETKEPIDKQAAVNAIIKRFEQVLPERFTELAAGGSPKPFNWKDPSSNKLYRFEFEGAGSLDSSTPKRLLGFSVDGASKTPVFSVSSLDSKRWLIEQCDFNDTQLRSLSLAQKLNNLEHLTPIKGKELSASSTSPTASRGLER